MKASQELARRIMDVRKQILSIDYDEALVAQGLTEILRTIEAGHPDLDLNSPPKDRGMLEEELKKYGFALEPKGGVYRVLFKVDRREGFIAVRTYVQIPRENRELVYTPKESKPIAGRDADSER